MTNYGPTIPLAEEIHAQKYRQSGESFEEAMTRVAQALADDDDHFWKFREILLGQRFMPGGRVQAAMGAARVVTPYNCFVSRTIPDSLPGIMEAAGEAARTMQLGGGIGYDFSTIRPKGARITSLDSYASGPISFMHIFDAVCRTIMSAGMRRGAMMGTLRIDHPDIEEFIEAKQNTDQLTQFNLSVLVTDDFMQAVEEGVTIPLVFEGTVYRHVHARALWEKLMRATWDWAEPGVLFVDRINDNNNLWYCEDIQATNPCGEQPLPPYGACLLGSFNLTKYLRQTKWPVWEFDWDQFKADIPVVVRAMDNIIDRAVYPLIEQEVEAKMKRRMGLGVTGLANAVEALGYEYGGTGFLTITEAIMTVLSNQAYMASARLAAEKGSFPKFNREHYLLSDYVQETLHEDTREAIRVNGIRNSHLITIAPTGTISLTANNVSSGIEPVFAERYNRTYRNASGQLVTEVVSDYGVKFLGVTPKTADQCSVQDHLGVLKTVSKYVDSAVSKTCNVGDEVTWSEFNDVYRDAWLGGCKGCTTFRASGKRFGILNKIEADEAEPQASSCTFDPETGRRSCE